MGKVLGVVGGRTAGLSGVDHRRFEPPRAPSSNLVCETAASEVQELEQHNPGDHREDTADVFPTSDPLVQDGFVLAPWDTLKDSLQVWKAVRVRYTGAKCVELSITQHAASGPSDQIIDPLFGRLHYRPHIYSTHCTRA